MEDDIYDFIDAAYALESPLPEEEEIHNSIDAAYASDTQLEEEDEKVAPRRREHTWSLLDFPPEIILEISNHLAYTSAVALRFTCRALHKLIPLPETSPPHIYNLKPSSPYDFFLNKPYTIYDLLEIETWPYYSSCEHFDNPSSGVDYFACARCLKFRDTARFSNRMLAIGDVKAWMEGGIGAPVAEAARPGPTSPDLLSFTQPGWEWSGRLTRMCIDCEIEYFGYNYGATLIYGGKDKAHGGGVGFVCLQCGIFVTNRKIYRNRDRLCKACFEVRDRFLLVKVIEDTVDKLIN